MSWLSSVNNLLDNLDGQAETVAETVAEQATGSGLSNNLRRLNKTIASNANALTSNIANVTNNDKSSDSVGDWAEEEDYYDDGSFSSFEDDDSGGDMEFTTDADQDADRDADQDEDENEYEIGEIVQGQNAGIEMSGNDDPIIDDANEILSAPAKAPAPNAPIAELLPPTNDDQKSNEPPLDVANDSTKADPQRSDILESIAPAATVTQSVSNQKAPPAGLRNLPTKEVAKELIDDEKSEKSNSDLETTAHFTNTNKKTEVDKKSQQTASVPNKPSPAPIPQKQQRKESSLLKKQQQQHQDILASKNNTIRSLELQLTKLREELTKGTAEHEELTQRTKDLGEKLQSSEREIELQANELAKAAEEMEKIRTEAKEEREDIEDDHQDEMEDLQRNHQAALEKMKQDYEETIAEWKDRCESEQNLRQQEGGDSIKELQEANKREREALMKLAAATEERTALQAKLDLFVDQETTLKQQVESSLESAETVAAREQLAREELDEAAAMHAKQMAQRQKREAELEQTIFEMSAALTQAKQKLQQQGQILASPQGKIAKLSAESNQEAKEGPNYKEKFENVSEELETIRVQFTMETQRREALQQQLTEVSKERKHELSLAQSRQHQHDLKVADMESTIHRLQDSIRASENTSGTSTVQASNSPQKVSPSLELEGAKQEIASLSEQLLKQQVLAKNAKSEILALKGRLKVANARADDAEKAQYDSKYSSTPRPRNFDIEGGGSNRTPPPYSVRRRVKGGSSRRVQSIRSTLPCLGSGRPSDEGGVCMKQVALTVDAIDSWMIDTGSFMRHEPIARLGLLLYLMVLHVWSFALVVFHTVEVEHGDFGSMDSNPRHWREHG